MSTVALLQKWRDSGAISADQFDTLIAIVRKERFSVFVELNVLLYVGVLSLAAGVGWTINTYFADLGDAAILIGLTALLMSSLYYCFSHKPGMVSTTSCISHASHWPPSWRTSKLVLRC